MAHVVTGGSSQILKLSLNPRPKTKRSTGNVFKDLCLNRPKHALEAATLIVKLTGRIARKGLGIDEAAALLDLDPHDLSNLLVGNTKGFPVERLKLLIKVFARRLADVQSLIST